MGFEYKIVAELTESQINEIQLILQHKEIFDKKNDFNNQVWWDFRHKENIGKMPNLSIVVDSDGIYICQNLSAHLWEDLDELKKYILESAIDYDIVDYQEG